MSALPPFDGAGADEEEDEIAPAPVTVGGRLQINPQALRIVPAGYRRVWDDLGRQVEFDVAGRFRKKWTTAETLRVVVADPRESYAEVAEELDRSPGAVRYRRMIMIHLLREEYRARERAQDYRDDPKANHKNHDWFQVDEVLGEFGFYAMAITEQFAIARPLQQPSGGWRGDGTSTALASGMRQLKETLQELMRQARRQAVRPVGEGPRPGTADGGGDG